MPADLRCPAYRDGVCHREHAADGAARCPLFECEGCRRDVPWCFGTSEDELCNDCSVLVNAVDDDAPTDPRAYVS